MPSGQEPGSQDASLRQWRRQRAAAFRREIVPYLRYVAQSGFALVLSFIVLTLLAGYARLLADMPEDWPSRVVGTVALAAVCLCTPLRTYTEPADLVFTLPMERSLLRSVFLPALRRSAINAGIRVGLLFAIYAPLYVRAPSTKHLAPDTITGWILLTLALALWAAWNVTAAWNERRFAAAIWRNGLRLLRYAATFAVVYALLTRSLVLSLPFAILVAAAIYAAGKLTVSHALPWEQMLILERKARRRWAGFLGWFVDVPSDTPTASKRSWIAWTADRLPRSRHYAWHFLYAKTLLRGESFGAYWRWNALLAVVLIFAQDSTVDIIAYCIAIVIGGLQLGELGRVRFIEQAAVVPLPPNRRRTAAAAVVRVTGAVATVLLWLVAALPDRPFESVWWVTILVLALVWTGWLLPRRLALSDDEDEE